MINTVRIQVVECLDPTWSAWLDGFTIILGDHGTTLMGQIESPESLNGLIDKLRNLGVTLLSVEPVDCNDPALSD